MRTFLILQFCILLSLKAQTPAQVAAGTQTTAKDAAAAQPPVKGAAAVPPAGKDTSAVATAKALAAAQQQKKILTDAASGGTPLPGTINVADNVNVEAVMLPREISRRVFGSNVADHYAVIEVNISNRSNDAALIIQSLFIDLSEWKLAAPVLAGSMTASGLARQKSSKSFQAKASTTDVASVEYRIVRGQLLDAQPWTSRNVAFRTIKVLGSIGTSFAFPFSKDVITGIGAWNGAVVPGFESMFPDGMEAQLNRISDYGFRNNKIIPQQSADIVIAFFPIDRFLTPTLSKAFLQSPSLFFNPLLMALDPSTRTMLQPILLSVFRTDDEVRKAFAKLLKTYADIDLPEIADAKAEIEDDAAEIRKLTAIKDKDEAAVQKDQATDTKDTDGAKQHQHSVDVDIEAIRSAKSKLDDDSNILVADLKPLKDDELYRFLDSLSLNNIHIVVSGIMTVDELDVPSTIDSTCFDKAGAEMWGIAGDKTCTISGKFLSSGVPKIPDADKLGISTIAVNKDASSDQLITFTFKLKAPLDPTVEFDILVTKDDKNGKSIDSMKYHVSSAFVLPGPTITSVTQKDAAATVTGTNFYSGPKSLFSASIRPVAAKDDKSDAAVKATPAETATSFGLDTSKFDAKKAPPGCYLVVVNVGSKAAVSTDKLRVSATPKITKASTNADNSIEVVGDQLVSTKDCSGTEPTFDLLDASKVVLVNIPLSKATPDSGKLKLGPAGIGDKPAAWIQIHGSADDAVAVAAK